MTAQQPEDRGEAYAEQQQEDLSIRDDGDLTDLTTVDNQRLDADPAGDLQAETGSPTDDQ